MGGTDKQKWLTMILTYCVFAFTSGSFCDLQMAMFNSPDPMAILILFTVINALNIIDYFNIIPLPLNVTSLPAIDCCVGITTPVLRS